jgi:N-methylhydantoinase A
MSAGLLAVDVGGTFTDVIGIRDGRIEAAKVPSVRERPEAVVIEGAKLVGLEDRSTFNHASTVGLNALLTRRLPKVAFLTTYGHRDMLDAARSWRPLEGLTDPGWRRSFGDTQAPLVPRYLRRGIRERITAAGDVLIELDEEQAHWELQRLQRCSVEGVAICLLNSYLNASHEERLRDLVGDVLGDIPCSISSAVSPLAKEYARASTTVIDVFMKLIYTDYAGALDRGLRQGGFTGDLNFADSAATLMEFEYSMRKPFRLVFSGPAAGAVASAHFGGLIGDAQLLCCDVGGTSSDISAVVGGEPHLRATFELEPDLIVNALAVDLGSLGAGGGSIVSATPSGDIRVGPESAGGDPGPACYGRGGTAPTVTDAFLAIGILDPDRFNAGRMKLDPERSLAAFRGLEVALSLEERISFAYRIALNNIAEGLVDVAIGRGLDPRDFSLVAFGAAGPLMLPAVLEHLQARRVIVPPYPGLFSALGLLSSDRVYSENRSGYVVLTGEAAPRIAAMFEQVEAELRSHLQPGQEAVVKRTFDGRLVGQSWETPFIPVPAGPIDEAAVAQMVSNFHDSYESRYGNRFGSMPVESVTYRVQLIVPSPKVSYPTLEPGDGRVLEPSRTIALRFIGGAQAGEYERETLRAGAVILGPAIIREPMSTTHMPAGQRATVGSYGEIVIERADN